MKKSPKMPVILVLTTILLLSMALIAGCSTTGSTTTAATQSASNNTTAAVSTTSSQSAATIEYKFATSHGPESPLLKEVWVPWAEDIEKATNGRVKITIYPGEALGSESTYIEAVKSGMIDIAWDSLEYFEGRFILSMVGYYPMGAQVGGTMCYAWWDLYKEFPEIQAEYEGLRVLAVDGSNSYQVFVSKKAGKEVNTIEDMKGLKLKAGGGTLNEAVLALGGSPVTIPAPQMYEAIQKGTIDGAWFPISDSTIFVLQDVCSSVTVVNGPPCGFFTMMNEDAYARMTPEDQAIFDSYCGDSLIERTAKLRYALDQRSAETIQNAGVKIINPAADEYAKFQTALDTMTPPWLEKVDATGQPATEIYNRGKELVAQWDASGWWK